ncbi:tetratricopeptide repeat protein [Salipaludibacillus sp. HK11]|uniref:tetratricopeptide repeat protein n=1 Tax=Salipaludibacillus sp. HK11 TaxID=3394320 RepID=UPI0039FD3FCC
MPSIGANERKGQVIPFMQDGGYFYKKGIEAYQSKSIERAISFFERAIKLEPEEPIFVCQLAIVLSEEGNYEASNEWLEKIKNDIDPSMSECYFFMANNMAHIGEFEQAKINLETYLDIDEDGEFVEDAESLLSMVTSEQQESGIVEDLSKNQSAEDKINFLLIGLLNRGEYAEVENEVRKLIAENPDHWNLYVYLAESLMYQDKKAEAETLLKDLLLKEEPNFLAQCQMAVLLHQQNNPQACMWVENIVNLRPMNNWNCYYLARSLYFVGEYETAYAWYGKLLNGSSFPKLPHLDHQMAILAWHCGDLDVSRSIWEKIKKLDPEKQSLLDELLSELDKGNSPSKDKKQFLYR